MRKALALAVLLAGLLLGAADGALAAAGAGWQKASGYSSGRPSSAAQIIRLTPGPAVSGRRARTEISRYWRRALALGGADTLRVSACHVIAVRGQKCAVALHAPIIGGTPAVWVHFHSVVAPDGTVFATGRLR